MTSRSYVSQGPLVTATVKGYIRLNMDYSNGRIETVSRVPVSGKI
jgi:hypothetical protein